MIVLGKILLTLPLRLISAFFISFIKGECFIVVIWASDDSVKMFVKCSMPSSEERERDPKRCFHTWIVSEGSNKVKRESIWKKMAETKSRYGEEKVKCQKMVMGRRFGGEKSDVWMEGVSVAFTGDDEQLKERMLTGREWKRNMYVCIYSSGDSHPCCAVLQDFPQLGFLGEAVCPSGLASVWDANYSHG